MQSKIIDKEQFKEAIRISFKDDLEIKDFYDDNVRIETTEDIIKDISDKINFFGDDAIIKGVFQKDNLIGYYVYLGDIKMLVSFSINNTYRVKHKLVDFFELIRKDLGNDWGCLLWSKNHRAIKWLQKMKLKVIDRNALITTLHFN